MKKQVKIIPANYEVVEQLVRLTAFSKKGKPVTAIFDLDDLAKVKAINSWYAIWHKDFNSYLIQSKIAKKINGKMHVEKSTLSSLILNVSPNAPIHHLNGNILDNRKSNLKIYDRFQKNDYEELSADVIAIHLKNRYGYLVAKALISRTDLDRVVTEEYTWTLKKHLTGQPFVIANTQAGVIALERYLTNCPEEAYVYHINKNPLDNRRENLEIKPNIIEAE